MVMHAIGYPISFVHQLPAVVVEDLLDLSQVFFSIVDLGFLYYGDPGLFPPPSLFRGAGRCSHFSLISSC